MVKEIRFCKFKRLVVWAKGKFGTGEGLLWYGICARCKKRLPGVRGAFSGALGAQNRLLGYGRDIRYRKRPPPVRGAPSVRITKKGMQKNCTPTINSPDNLPSTSNSPDSQTTHPTIKPQLFDFDTTRSRNFLLLNTLRQRNVKHTVHHLSLNGVKVDVFRKSKALMV